MGFDPTWVANLVENRFALTGTFYLSESELISDLQQSGWGASSSAGGRRGRPDSHLVFNLFLSAPGALLGVPWESAFTLELRGNAPEHEQWGSELKKPGGAVVAGVSVAVSACTGLCWGCPWCFLLPSDLQKLAAQWCAEIHRWSRQRQLSEAKLLGWMITPSLFKIGINNLFINSHSSCPDNIYFPWLLPFVMFGEVSFANWS